MDNTVCTTCTTFHHVRPGKRLAVAVAHLQTAHHYDAEREVDSSFMTWGPWDRDVLIAADVRHRVVLDRIRAARLQYAAHLAATAT